MIVFDARDNADRPQPKNHVEFKGDNLWENPGAPMVQLKLNMETVRAHMELSDQNNVPALFNFVEQSWELDNADFIARHQWWIKTLKQIRDVNPSQVIGCYAEAPVIDYWNPVIEQVNKIEKSQDSANQWAKAKLDMRQTKLLNNRLAAIAQPLSVICPSLYLHYEQHDNNLWAAYARWNIAEAKQYGKPVYAVVWPRYHTSLKVIDLDRWKRYIDAVKACKPDGLIVWDYSGHGPWKEVEDHFGAL